MLMDSLCTSWQILLLNLTLLKDIQAKITLAGSDVTMPYYCHDVLTTASIIQYMVAFAVTETMRIHFKS